MIKFSYHKYELQPITQIGAVADAQARHGALFQVQWPSGRVGYADLHPWPELGDADLESQILGLSKGKISEQMEQTIWFAKRDADARLQGVNAFQGLPKVKNHFLINDLLKIEDGTLKEIRNAGYTTLKLKVGKQLEEEAKSVSRIIKQNPFMVRLDFNAKLDWEHYKRFMESLHPSERAKIEFVEDPMPWDLEAWQEATQFAPLAIDGEYEKISWNKINRPPFKVMVIKPARIDVEKAVSHVHRLGLKMVVTSALDHPVGVAHSLWVAGELKKFNPNILLECGCLTLRSYKPNDFTPRITTMGPFLNHIAGTGIGFDELLSSLPWVPLTPGA